MPALLNPKPILSASSSSAAAEKQARATLELLLPLLLTKGQALRLARHTAASLAAAVSRQPRAAPATHS
jgi:hypothetical protein